ncbi:MBL fold metallo-hydrolase [Conexibacter sp. DBS9H8]|uniref:MBL fold metallo-hydrolase n=1 Tax=Conexibacter sp. DBS9H8 TaxID=2937801 RepID=UPI00200C92D2|nr:MBL fold metallo-hydrolase [Conexibacter sp. DBS9H8]
MPPDPQAARRATPHVALNPHTAAPGITRFTVPLAIDSPDHLHVHMLQTPDGPLLIDCGARGSEDALDAGLATLDARPSRVLITHGHIDHWGIATTLTDRVLAHPGTLSSLRFASHGPPARRPAGWPNTRELARAFGGFSELIAGVPEIDPIHDGDRLGDWEVLWTPGHDPGHICLYRASDGILLCGDLLLPGYTPNIQPALDGSDALDQFLTSLDRIAALPITLVLPAHGPPYSDAGRRANELKVHHIKRLDTLRHALRGGPRTLAELTTVTFTADHSQPADKMLAHMETYAHLEHLRQQRQANVDEHGTWSLT